MTSCDGVGDEIRPKIVDSRLVCLGGEAARMLMVLRRHWDGLGWLGCWDAPVALDRLGAGAGWGAAWVRLVWAVTSPS